MKAKIFQLSVQFQKSFVYNFPIISGFIKKQNFPNDRQTDRHCVSPQTNCSFPNYSNVLISGNFPEMIDKDTKNFEFPVSQNYGSYSKENTSDLHYPQWVISYRTGKCSFTLYPRNVIILYK